jgi:3-hydroxybutyryl-CoA dehydratase
MLDRWYEELEVGQDESYSGVTLTETHIVNFASLSGDWNALHMDEEYAKSGPFGRRIAHGFLTVVLMNGRVPMAPGRVAAFYGIDRLRFTGPVYIGDTLHLEMTVTAKHDRGPGGIVTFEQIIKNQHDDVVVKGQIKVLINQRPT